MGITSCAQSLRETKASKRRISCLPGYLLCGLFFGLCVLAWPGVLGRIVSLDWRVGDIRPVAWGLHLVFGVSAAISWLERRWVNSLYARIFPNAKRRVFVVVSCFLSLLGGVALAEFGLRLLDMPFRPSRARAETPLARFDPELGWTYVPSRSTVQQFGQARRSVVMHFDAIGSRIRTPAFQRDLMAPTILFVGDSYTMGHGLPFEETFVGHLESNPDFPFQVVNLGVQAFGTDQSLLMLKRYFRAFQTRAVVYTFLDVHILRNSKYDRRLINPRAIFLGTKPQFALRADGSLYLSKKPLRYGGDYRYSRAWALIEILWTRWGPKPRLDLTRALIREMKAYVESSGAEFILVHWDQGNYWDPPQTLPPGESPFLGMDLHVVDPGRRASRFWQGWTIPGDGHPDARAHAFVAELLAEEIRRVVVEGKAGELP